MFGFLFAVVFAIQVPAGSIVYYTLDGSYPTAGSLQYTGPITIDHSCTVRAMSVNSNNEQSPTTTEVYTLIAGDPVITADGLTVTITSPSGSDVDIFYALGGNLPGTSSTKYTGPFTVDNGTTVRAMAAQTGWTSSNTTTMVVAD